MLNKENIEEIFPLTALQEGMFFLQQLDPGSTTYTQQSSFEIQGKLRPELLERSMQLLFARYANLRAVFIQKGKLLLQVILKQWEAEFKYLDLGDASEAEIVNYLKEDLDRPFALGRDPLLRLHVLRSGPGFYTLMLTHHHILMDGWSAAILKGELFQLYQGLAQGVAPRVLAPPVYRNYLNWLKHQNREETKEYWANYLEGYVIGQGVPRIPGRSPQGAGQALEIQLDDELKAALDKLAEALQVTAGTIFLAAFGLTLAYCSDNEDIVFGTVVSGRSAGLPGIERMVGLFSNTVPCRLKFSGKMSVVELLQNLTADQFAGMPHHYYSLSEIQKAVTDGAEMLSALFAYENYPRTAWGPANSQQAGAERLQIEGEGHISGSNYPFNVLVLPGENVKIKVQYDANVIRTNTAQFFLEGIEEILGQMVAAPHGKIQELRYMRKARQEKLIEMGKGPQVELPSSNTLVDFIMDRIEKEPHSVALTMEGEKLSYRELGKFAEGLAAMLQRSGIGRGDVVGILADRSFERIVAIVATLRAGAAFLPFAPDTPAARLTFCLEDAQARFCILGKENRLPGAVSLPSYSLDLWYEMSNPEGFSPVKNEAEDPAYVIYTSGSTGKPKGVQVPQRAAINLVTNKIQTFDLKSNDCILQFASPAFDASVAETLMTLCAGATLCIYPQDGLGDSETFVKYLQDEKVNFAILPPVFLATLSEFHLGFLRTIVTAGAPPIEKDARMHAKRTRYANAYGPTECAVWSTNYILDSESEIPATIPIGKPIGNMRAYILNENQAMLPMGAVGELCLSGESVATGYLGWAAAHADSFTADPFVSGARMYRTGDRARMLDEGEIEFLGRSDHQVNLRGYRVELGEIEAAINAIEGIREAAVKLVEEEGSGGELVAWYEAVEALPVHVMQEKLQTILPTYMIPGRFIHLKKFPQTLAGKTDRDALELPGLDHAAQKGQYQAANSTLTFQLLEIWKKIIGTKAIGIEDDFFALGGHSITAVLLVGEIYRKLGHRIDVRTIFEHPTVAALAKLIEKSTAQEFKEIPLVPVAADYPASRAQRRMWIQDKFPDQRLAWNVPGFFRLKGTLQVEALQQAALEMVRRHEILRTIFREEKGAPRQVIQAVDATVHGLRFLDARNLTQPEEVAAKHATASLSTEFDLEKGPLLRWELIQTEAENFVFVMTMHHIIGDGWSMGILARELIALYKAYCQNEVAGLPPLRIQYKDYAVWHQAWLQSPQMQKDEAYWLDRFAGKIPRLELATDFPRPQFRTAHGAYLSIILPPDDRDGLHAIARRNGASLFMVLLAGLTSLLYRYYRQNDIVIGSPVAGRTHPDLEDQLGFFINNLALRFQFKPETSFTELVEVVRDSVLEAYDHQQYPFDMLVGKLGERSQTGATPLFDVNLVLQNAGLEDGKSLDLPEGLEVVPYDIEFMTNRYDLLFNCKEDQRGIFIKLEYNSDIFKRERIIRLRSHFIQLIQAEIKQPDVPVRSLNYLSAEELSELSNNLNHP